MIHREAVQDSRRSFVLPLLQVSVLRHAARRQHMIAFRRWPAEQRHSPSRRRVVVARAGSEITLLMMQPDANSLRAILDNDRVAPVHERQAQHRKRKQRRGAHHMTDEHNRRNQPEAGRRCGVRIWNWLLHLLCYSSTGCVPRSVIIR